MTFWEHLDELRKVLVRAAIVLMLLMFVAFFNKQFLFDDVVLAPLSSDFALYKGINRLLAMLHFKPMQPFNIEIMNIDMAAQFFTHIKVALYAAIVVGMPFIIYQLWTFVRPALYKNEKHTIRKSFAFASVLFYVGVVVGYYLILPLTVRFLGTYQVSEGVPNQISLNSYIGMFVSLILIMGIVFEMPMLAMILSHFGIISKEWLKKYRRHAIVILVVVAAIITPSGDAVTLFFVAAPLYILYEFSILVCKSSKKDDEDEDEGKVEVIIEKEAAK